MVNKEYLIESWQFIWYFNRWKLTGLCPERGRSGPEILTSRVMKIDGRKVFTRSGSVYNLGKPNPHAPAMTPWMEKLVAGEAIPLEVIES